MTPEQEATCEYLIAYRNPDGSLLLPQFGGCWHCDITERESFCAECGEHYSKCDNPNLATPQGFFDLKNAMKRREDYNYFLESIGGFGPGELGFTWPLFPDDDINPLTFPSTVATYLKGLER